MKNYIGILAIISIFYCSTALAKGLEATNREENDIWLSGALRERIDDAAVLGPFGESRAMVCGMRHRNSILSVRSEPNVQAREVFRAPYYAKLELTGDLSTDKRWAKVKYVIIEHDIYARRLPKTDFKYIGVSGWAAIRYLCNFVDY